ncbi:hypothetical protein PHMEG_00022961 [Phytophthora megakarya]|uniref:Uncharacterized protein n=1 Tax=Phytophthora megakarya TaxID=4795 RepID=A0A225VJU0_9STRA|nr:hypothetical protein PHMEG_00022961 [Phytophthora megakarya]
MKAGLVLYNAELQKLHQYLDEHSREKVSSPSPRTKALLAENASLREGSSDDSLELEFPEATPDPNSGSDVRILEKSFISVVKVITTKGYESAEDDVIYVHEPADVALTDYAQELAFLPDFSDHSPTELDFSAANVMNSALSVDDQAKLVNVLKTHKNIMIASEVLDLTSDDVVTSLPVKDSSPFSSPVVSFFPRKGGRPRRSTSVASELRMRESLEKELADDDFMLGLTAEGSVAGTMDSAPSKKGSDNPVSSLNAVAEVSGDSSAGDDHHTLTGEDSVVEAPVETGAPVDDAPSPESSVSGASDLGAVHSPSTLPPRA